MDKDLERARLVGMASVVIETGGRVVERLRALVPEEQWPLSTELFLEKVEEFEDSVKRMHEADDAD